MKLFSPELFLILGCLALFVVSIRSDLARMAADVALVTSLLSLVACALSLQWEAGELFYQAYRVDAYSQLFKLMVLAGLVAVVLFGRRLKDIPGEIRPEYFLFLLFGALGLVMVVSAVELITLFIALELASYALYILVPLRQERPGQRVQMESAAKYVMFGIVATGIMLFGMSYLFGLTGSTYFRDIAPILVKQWHEPAAVVGMILVLVGLFFKLAAFPMHLWVPDVYQGASNETTAFIAGVPKAAAVAIIIRFLLCTNPAEQAVTTVLLIVSVCSMFFGNLAALAQKDIKRMLGYSSIAHAGYVMLGFVTLRESGYAAATFYILGFVVMSLASFLVICQLSRTGENVRLDDLSGLHARAPLAALILGTSMFALAGIPPFVGFMGKFLLMSEALTHGFVVLVILAAVNTAIGVYYYLSVVRIMYFSEPGDRPAVRLDRASAVLGVLLVAVMLLLGVVPARVLDATLAAVRAAVL